MNRFIVAAELKTVGIALKYDSSFREYRVAFRGGSEASAYYTDDLSDARDTGLAMARDAARRSADHAARFGYTPADIHAAV